MEPLQEVKTTKLAGACDTDAYDTGACDTPGWLHPVERAPHGVARVAAREPTGRAERPRRLSSRPSGERSSGWHSRQARVG